MKASTLSRYIFLFLIISFFISCTADHYRVAEITAYAVKEAASEEYEEVREGAIESLIIEVRGAYGIVSEADLPKDSTQPMYAGFDPPEAVYDNNIIYEKTELVLDKDVYYKDELIAKGTNLRGHSDIKDHIWLKHLSPKARRESRFVIGFDEQFYENINIPAGEYTITIICHTDDELKLESSIVKTIELKQ